MELKITCARCGESFTANCDHLNGLKLKSVPKRCPSCNDAIQHRPKHAVVTRRQLLEEWGGVVIALPDRFVEHRDKVSGGCSRHAVFSGRDGGDVLWSGRMDVWDTRPSDTALGHVRLMRVWHELAHGETDDATERARHVTYDSDYRYLAIDHTSLEKPMCALIYASVGWKTTLKGFGRQVHCDIDDDAIWSYQMRSSCRRTGRYGTRMIIGVVNDYHPIATHLTGDSTLSMEYSLAAPRGEELDPTAEAGVAREEEMA